MNVTPLSIPGMKVVILRPHFDHRGYFVEAYKKEELVEGGIEDDFVQHNETLSMNEGTVRGYHFQVPGYNRMARVVKGRVFFSAIDLRPGSPTYRQTWDREVRDDGLEWLYLPSGIAWAYMTLEPHTKLQYMSSRAYDGSSDRTIRYDTTGVNWPLLNIVVSERDDHGMMLDAWCASPEAELLRYGVNTAI